MTRVPDLRIYRSWDQRGDLLAFSGRRGGIVVTADNLRRDADVGQTCGKVEFREGVSTLRQAKRLRSQDRIPQPHPQSRVFLLEGGADDPAHRHVGQWG